MVRDACCGVGHELAAQPQPALSTCPQCQPAPATRLPSLPPAVLQIAEHVLGQHRYRAPGDDGKNAGDDRYIDK
jgi:hypothetical protein